MSNDLAKQLRADAEAYRQSLASPDTNDMFSLAYQWQDKKHRHVYDLCRKLETAADRIEQLETVLRFMIRNEEVNEALAKASGEPYVNKGLDFARTLVVMEGKDD
jgi:translation initiation factor 2 beta subunit (eIF-2beta)/eIF-5